MSSDQGQGPAGDHNAGNGPQYSSGYGVGSYGAPSSYGMQSPYSGQPGHSAASPYGEQAGAGQLDPGGAGQPYPGGPQGVLWGYGPGYGVSAYGYGAAGGYPPQEHPRGTTVLVLGILGLAINFFIGIGFVLGIIAMVMGKRALSDMDANPGIYTNRGAVTAGAICGLISCIMAALGLLFIIMIFVIAAVAAGTGS